MKVAVVIPKYGLVGGAEAVVSELCVRLAARKEFQIHVFANKWHKNYSQIIFHKVPIITFPRFLRPISFAYFANKHICRNNFDVIHSHERIFSMNLFTFHGIPHKTWIRKTKRKRLSLFDRATAWVEKKGINNPDLSIIMAVSSLVKDELLNLYDIPASKICVIHPGISMDRFFALDREACRQEIRQNNGLSEEDIVALFVSMNFELKRLDLVLKSIADLVERKKYNRKLKLLVVGKGNKRKYQTIARSLGIGNRIVFAGVTKEVEKYYLASDIFVMPSKYDTFGLAVLEAMAAGLPVIITGKVGAKDLVEDGVNGFILSGNPSFSDMTAALTPLMDRNRRRKMGESGREIALRQTWDKHADRVAFLYHQLAGQNKR